jgi:hypothetical protein
MSGVYVPGAFSKKKEVVPDHVEVPVEVIAEVHVQIPVEKDKITPQIQPPRAPRAPKPTIVELKPVEVKQAIWGVKQNFIDCLKNAEVQDKEIGTGAVTGAVTGAGKRTGKGKVIIPLWGHPIAQKEIKKEELDFFMDKYDSKLRKLYENTIYYDKEFLDKLRINGEQGYKSFCKFMYHVI